jgi:hypothetical protein
VTGKKMKNAIEVNKIALLSIDVKTSFGKIAFNFVRGCKSKEYSDGNATTAWEKLYLLLLPLWLNYINSSEILH